MNSWEATAPFWIALFTAAVVAYPTYKMLLALKSRQTVSQFAPEGHQKKQGTPTMGGIIIVIGVLAALVGSSLLPSSQTSNFDSGFNVQLFAHVSGDVQAASLILLLGFALIGFVDDFVVPRLFTGKRGLGWKQKIGMQVVLALLATGVMTHWALSAQSAIYIFFILFCSNAYNFLDGLDALAGSVLIALCGGLLSFATMSGYQPEIGCLGQSLIGATIPFLLMNAPPAKVFMGDIGSLPIGALLGLVLSLLLWPAQATSAWHFYTPYSQFQGVYNAVHKWVPGHFLPAMLLPVIVISLVLVAELVPVPMQIFWVKVFNRKLFLYTPIHHAFEKKGVSETRVVWHFLLVQLLLSVLAYTILSASTWTTVPSDKPNYSVESRP